MRTAGGQEMSERVEGSVSLASAVTQILRAYLDVNLPQGVSSVREIGLAMQGNNALGPGCEIVLSNGARFHVAVIEQSKARRSVETMSLD